MVFFSLQFGTDGISQTKAWKWGRKPAPGTNDWVWTRLDPPEAIFCRAIGSENRDSKGI